ncbi:MAG: GntR family transcriptional regulator [Noviherbaspirillum sp.]
MAREMTRANVRDPEAIAVKLDELREKVRMLIQNGELKQGERVNELALAAQLGVSRNAARDALRSLEQSGLVTIIPNRGAEVRRVLLEDALHLYDIRAGLSRTSGRLIALRITAEEEKELLTLADRMDAAVEHRNYQEYHDLNAAFHSVLMSITKNPRLIALNDAVENELKLYLNKGVFTLAQMRMSQLEHRKILEAIMSGQPEVAAEAFERHVLTGKQRMLDTTGSQVRQLPVTAREH